MKTYICNTFSLSMVDDNCVIKKSLAHVPTIEHEIIPALNGEFDDLANVPGYKIISAVNHPDIAAVLGVPFSRINVHLKKGDVAYIAQLQGGRLPEGCTKLPIGFSFKWVKLTVE
ncbi:MAG: hypothetical protein MJZ15_04585 [Bacteroidales bacterium]|nr:hypothetical protein [Bacteroidales bacterium]